MKCDSVTKYDHKVKIQKPSTTATADAHGHVDLTSDANWQNVISPFCSVISKGGREFWKVQQVNADVSYVWTSQWSRTLEACTTDHRLICDGVAYEILAVINVDLANQEIQIQTRRAV